MSKQLLTEWNPLEYDPKAINEQKEATGKIMLRGVIQRANTLNQNSRVYPREILEREVRNYQKFIQENRSTGELDHPSESVVNLKNVSHILREVRMDGDNVHGVVELLNTPSGKIAQELVSAGVRLGISSRGVGSTKKENGVDTVQSDYIIICWDLVQDPSTAAAFLFSEGKQHVADAEVRKILNRSDRIDRLANDILSRHVSK